MTGRSSESGLAKRLRSVATPNARFILDQRGVKRVVLQGLKPIAAVEGPIAGPARTIRYLPAREDVREPPRGELNRWLCDNIDPGEIMVCDALGCVEGAVLGDMMAARAKHRRASGVVVDGVVRDVEGLTSIGLPVYARGSFAHPFRGRLLPWETDVPIQCGGALVQPQDWILADETSVIVIPADLAELVAQQDKANRAEEAFCQALLAAGFPLDAAYPLPESMRPYLERYCEDGTVPTLEQVQEEFGSP